jgi:hypothetical protein
MDRRLHKRFDLNAPVTYSWKDRPGIRRSGHGTTRDVSECGLFVLSDSLPPVGTAIQFEVSFSFRDDSRVQMRARGMIVRVEANGSAETVPGFAASTKALWMYHTATKSAEGFVPRLSARSNRKSPEIKSE